MKKTIIYFLLGFFFFSCNQANRAENVDANSKATKNSLEKDIKELETRLKKAKDVQKELDSAKALVSKSQELAETFPDEKNTADVLFRAADVARGIGDYGKSIQLWGKVWRKYPDYHRAADALFMQGFTFENNLKDYNQAKNYYIQFLEKYPEHKLYEQAKLSLKNLGKSPEDLIKEFQKKKE